MKQYTLHLLVILLLAMTAWPLVSWVDVRLSDEAGVRLSFPSVVGEWRGMQVQYCHNTECSAYGETTTDGFGNCQFCRGIMVPMTPVEREQLPMDTKFMTFKYTKAGGDALYVSIVLSGSERNSIHRPQRCLVGQGTEIVGSRVMTVPMVMSKPLDVMVLDVLRHYRGASGGARSAKLFYAYWFVGQGRETPSHFVRMFWLAWDRLFHGVAHKWAYVIVQGDPLQFEAAQSVLKSFIADFYAQIAVGRQ